MNQEEITNLDMAVALFSKSGSIQEMGAFVATSVRLPLGTHALCKAISQHSGESLNRVVVQLITVGLDAVMANLPEADIKAIINLENAIMNTLVEDEFKGVESGEIN